MRRASPPQRWLDPARGPNPSPMPDLVANPAPTEDRNVTYHMGRAFRDESSIPVPVDRVTPDERATMRAHALAAREARQADMDANLARAVELGAALKVLAGEDD